ncbi:MOSC domain-containing protein [Thiohalocapsa marina]|uniref:MOSC domain-containing protein n=1 Tax=Thiohalocapsa marina TaxID=424902 RepID=A0A5M8FD39_9GAMM|nr:MOSC domain-containing protein [Thiohalocapsa marina]KAA6182304.1 MOSC domain-containing protein [Thiohalocapsa marina]
MNAWRHRPLLEWLGRRIGRLSRQQREGELSAIFISAAAGALMRPCDEALAIVDRGLAEDRYALGRGFWRLTDGCQVTLIYAEDLRRAERRHGLSLSAGQHRRNLVVSGLAGLDLRGVSLRIGEALFEWHRVRPPCGYLDRVAGAGTAKALGRHAGHCLRVREGGRIKLGDRVTLI